MGQWVYLTLTGSLQKLPVEVIAKQETTEPLSYSAPLFVSLYESNKQTLFFPFLFLEEVDWVCVGGVKGTL